MQLVKYMSWKSRD